MLFVKFVFVLNNFVVKSKKNQRFLRFLCETIALLALCACVNDPYESGDGKYSYLRADFGEIRTGASTVALGAVTDEGETLTFASPYTVSWALKADTIYRSRIYYDKQDDGKTTPQAISRVPVVKIYETTRPDTLKYDPVTFESAWVSKSGKYLNVGFFIKTGQAEGIDAVQTVGVMQEAVVDEGGVTTLRLKLFHDQKGVPEYYSSRAFISIPLKDVSADNIILSVPTYNEGWTTVQPSK